MSFTPLFVVNGTTYTVTELENLINNYNIWQTKYYKAEEDKASFVAGQEAWKNSYYMLEKELHSVKEKSQTAWQEAYDAGIKDAVDIMTAKLNTMVRK